MGCTMLLLPMGHGLYNVVQPMGHGETIIYQSIVQSMAHEVQIPHSSWIVQCCTTHDPWGNHNLPRHCTIHGPWSNNSPWPVDCTTLYNPWAMETGLPMGHGLYNVVQPVGHGISLYNLLL